MLNQNISEQLKNAPPLPGVYLFKGKDDKILYVGKAKNLAARLQSYLSSPKNTLLISAQELDYIVTDNEVEALILECNLIKKHKPVFNIKLRDDKRYPYLKITSEPFPRLIMVRKHYQEGEGKLFGPYPNVSKLRETIRTARKIFPIRTCRKKIGAKEFKPCLNYHLKKCLAPCQGKLSEQEYQKVVENLILFLSGKYQEVLKELEQEMTKASANLEFEKAALFRDKLSAVKKCWEAQEVHSATLGDEDIMVNLTTKTKAYIKIFLIRDGALIDTREIEIKLGAEESEEAILESFIKQYYYDQQFLPQRIFVERELPEREVIETWLQKKANRGVKILKVEKGLHKKLIQMAKKTLTAKLSGEIRRELKELFNLSHFPHRIEAFDVSNIQGKAATGSMSVLQEGVAAPEEYKRFKISSKATPDDYTMLKEIIKRRYRHSEFPFPELVILDGGKGQLSAAEKAFQEIGVSPPKMIALSKGKGEIWISGQALPLKLSQDNPIYLLFRTAQDEAHRFALRYHRFLRDKKSLQKK
jgi:excinuclease ABC subunit C